jgi:uncharacterized protein (DUF1330 family)
MTAPESNAPYYLIFDAEIRDPERFRLYADQVQPLIEAAGGRFLIQGGEIHMYEGDWNPSRIAVMAFSSKEAWDSFYFSNAYEPIKAIRHEASAGRLIGVEGLPPMP